MFSLRFYQFEYISGGADSHSGNSNFAARRDNEVSGVSSRNNRHSKRNWADRIRKIQRRLTTACRVATSVEDSVEILNAIVLPAVTFTAAAFQLPKWAEKQLLALQKNFLWQSNVETSGGKHKINPNLVFLTRKMGGIGLVSILLAMKTQKAKHALRWLTQTPDIYTPAWKFWIYHDREHRVSPSHHGARGAGKLTGPQLVNEWLQPAQKQREDRVKYLEQHYEDILEASTGWWDEDEGRFTVQLHHELPSSQFDWPIHIKSYWEMFKWSDNPWLGGPAGSTKQFSRIKVCSLGDLQMRRKGPGRYSFRVFSTESSLARHRCSTMCKWAIAIILQSPNEESRGSEEELKLRHQPKWLQNYSWQMVDSRIQGTPSPNGQGNMIVSCTRMNDGINWTISVKASNEEDVTKMHKWAQTEGVVFMAHPSIHEFPWTVDDRVANRNVVKALKKQAFEIYRSELSPGLPGLLERPEEKAQQDNWQRGLQQQTPRQVWNHDNALTAYQVWVAYRMVLCQLNLFYEGRNEDNACRKTDMCRQSKETHAHIFWECPCAQSCWKWLIGHWTGGQEESIDRHVYREYCAARKAPPITESMKSRLKQVAGAYKTCYEEVLERLWRVLATVCCSTLWIQRNRIIFEEETTSKEKSCVEFRTTGIQQLRAVARREKRSPITAEQGVWLEYCIEAFLSTSDQQAQVRASMKLARKSPFVAMIKSLGF